MKEQHTEYIICPNCKSIEKATVEHTMPWWSYVHHCSNCKYIIMESEWNLAGKTKDKLFDKYLLYTFLCLVGAGIFAGLCWIVLGA